MTMRPKRRIKVQLPDGRTVLPNGNPIRRNFTKKKLTQLLLANGVEDVGSKVNVLWDNGWQLVTLKLPKGFR